MSALTEAERLAWQRMTDAKREARRVQCTTPITPSNPVQPRTPGQFVNTLRAPKG